MRLTRINIKSALYINTVLCSMFGNLLKIYFLEEYGKLFENQCISICYKLQEFNKKFKNLTKNYKRGQQRV